MFNSIKNFINKNYKLIGLIFGIIIIILLTKEIINKWANMKHYVYNLKISFLIFSIILYCVFYFLMGMGWIILARNANIIVPKVRLLNIYYITQFAKYLPGGIWNSVSRFIALSEQGANSSSVVISIVMENVLIVISSLIISVFMVSFFQIGSFYIPIYIMILVLILMIFLSHPYAINKAILFIRKYLKKEIPLIEYKFNFLIKMVLYYLMAWGIFGLSFGFLILSFDVIELKQFIFSMFAFPSSWVVGFLSPSPGGLGIREGLLVILLQNYFNPHIAIYVSVVSRIWLIFGEICTFLIFFLTKLIFDKNSGGCN